MLIFTGMDNSGKTTLVNQLSKKLHLPIIKSMGPNFSKEEKHLWILDQLTREKCFPDSVLYDRFLPLEEMVYGKVLRGDPIYSLDGYYMGLLKELDPIITYTRPPRKKIFDFGDREQMKGVIKQREKLLLEWDSLMWAMMARGWNIKVYDYTVQHPVIEIRKREEK